MMYLTASDYQRGGPPRINARVFIDVWNFSPCGVDDEGVFAASDGSALAFTFDRLVEAIRGTDRNGTLSEEDLVNAAAMVFHMVPDMDGY